MATSTGVRPTRPTSSPIKCEIVDVQKIRGLSNYYEYIIKVLCKDGSVYHIYRRYGHFSDMHSALEKRFPIEAGAIKATDKILPNLPGRKILGRSAVRDVTEKRLPLLNTYLKDLFVLPHKICYDSIVTAFTRPTSDDLSRPYTGNRAYKTRQTDRPVRPPPIKCANQVDKPPRPQPPVLRQSAGTSHHLKPTPSPSAGTSHHLKPTPSPPKHSTSLRVKGKALYSYAAGYSDELSFQEGDILTLSELVDDGMWWHATLEGKSGLAPANYIEVIKNPVVMNFRDQVGDSDEWDSSDDTGCGSRGTITYYYNGAAHTVEVDQQLVTTPTFIALHRAIQKQLHQHDIVLNYKDTDGDLVQILEQDDIQLLTTDAIPPRRQLNKTCHAPWAIYVTILNDNSVYNTTIPR